MPLIHSNNYRTTTTASITNVATTLPVASVANLPSLTGGNTCYLTIQSGSTIEIVLATASSALDITVTRAQQGTTGVAFASGSIVSLRPTKESFDSKVQGPATATDSAFVLYDGTTGKMVKDGPGSSGTGNVVRVTSPALITPDLGVASATSINFGQDPLNYYEEGEFSPTITCATPGDLNVTYSSQDGEFTRIGNRYDFEAFVTFTPTYTTASGVIRMAGFPFTSKTTGMGSMPIPAVASANFIYSPTGGTLNAIATAGQSYLQFQVAASGTALTSQTVATSLTSGSAVSLRVKGTIFI